MSDLVPNTCQFTTDPNDPEDDWHYYRMCLFCGKTWWALHSPCDGFQWPCPYCKKRPVPRTCDGSCDEEES